MFTGLIETTGIVQSIQSKGGGKQFHILADFKDKDVKPGDSIANNGVCLTVEESIPTEKGIVTSFYASYKTLELTNLGYLMEGSKVNLERALLPTTRMGGHIVQGHVDGIGKVIYKEPKENGEVYEFKISLPEELARYTVERGSIAVDGISLTVVQCKTKEIQLVIIPETIRKTNILFWNIGTIVNIETDIMARYLEKWTKTELN